MTVTDGSVNVMENVVTQSVVGVHNAGGALFRALISSLTHLLVCARASSRSTMFRRTQDESDATCGREISRVLEALLKLERNAARLEFETLFIRRRERRIQHHVVWVEPNPFDKTSLTG